MRTQSPSNRVVFSPRSRLERECLPIGVHNGTLQRFFALIYILLAKLVVYYRLYIQRFCR